MPKVTICILAYNSEKTIADTIESCLAQDYWNYEVAVMENGSTDRTVEIAKSYRGINLYCWPHDIGMGKNMERCAYLGTDIIVFMCADDIFTDSIVIRDIARIFYLHSEIKHISRWYYQFADDANVPLRANRSRNIFKLADNVSGLAFRRETLEGVEITNDPFIEGASLLMGISDLRSMTLRYDTVAIRMGNGGSQTAAAFRIAPTRRWYGLVGNQPFLKDASIGYIQIKNWGTYRVLIDEIMFSVKLNPVILLRIDFWFFALSALLIPRKILRKLVDFYKNQIGRRVTKRKWR